MATLRKPVAKRGGGSDAAPAPRRRRASGKPLAKSAQTPKSANGGMTDDDLRKLVPQGLEAAFVKSKLHDKSLAVAGLGEPNGWTGAMPELPEDIASLDHNEMSNLLASLASALATALWNASKNYVEADAYDGIAEYLEDVALLDADESNEGKRKAQSRTDERVVAAQALQKTAYHNYVRFRDLARVLEAQWRTVSRVGGFVADEAEAETAGAIKASPTRGKSAGASRGKAAGEIKRRPRR